jgi:hypothetical protein
MIEAHGNDGLQVGVLRCAHAIRPNGEQQLACVVGVVRGNEPLRPWILGTPGSVRVLSHHGGVLEGHCALTHEMSDAVLVV